MIFARSVAGWLTRTLSRRHGGVLIFLGVFVAVSFLIRCALTIKAAGDLSWDWSLLAAFAWGLLYDCATAAWMSLPLIVLLTILPARIFQHRWARGAVFALAFGTLYALLFGAVSEWVFWDEFGVRLNFIAVDYLVYTSEVLGNIRESYPMPLILGGLLVFAVVLFLAVRATGAPRTWLSGEHEKMGRRVLAGTTWFVAMTAVGSIVQSTWLPPFANNFNREIGRNGLWSFVAAFRDNQINYDQFYATLPLNEAFARLRHELTEDGSLLLAPDQPDSLRFVSNPGPEQHLNVIQITVESLSAGFVGVLNPESDLTPNLDALADKSLVFERLYATGTRTDRGMEALALSLPPTPGRSIIKRPDNENMFTLGSVFRAKGYDTAFIYGGYGYFDNMNYFFGENGYRVVDRASVGADDVTFANVWGACDEDLYRWTLREADNAFAAGKPFHFFVMTTSNHRPYTFPDGRIDLPSKVSGRAGAVKYTDYAIGKLLRDAESKPWFKNTVFVIVADHCASSAGRTELPVENYHIPLFIYAPGGQIAPGRITPLTSQMDYAPTLLGLLNWSYPSRFFGHDVRRVEPSDAHALIGNYQKLGHLEKGTFVVLKPQRAETYYTVDGGEHLTEEAPDDYAEREAVSFYQAASYMYRNRLYRALSPEEFLRYSEEGQSLALSESAASEKTLQ